MYVFTKYFSINNLNNINEYSGLKKITGIETEIKCLTELTMSYKKNKCICGRGCHFPIILDYIPGKKVTMTYTGDDIRKIKKSKKYIKIHDAKLQILCILNSLMYTKIEHLDINENGKNICIDNNGKIYLIDFDIAFMGKYQNEKKLNNLMKKRLFRFRKYNTYKRIYNILKKCPNIILL